MGSPLDIQKLAKSMHRANSLIDRAVSVAEKGDPIMDRFEQRLNLAGEHFEQIDAYEKQLAAMQQMMGNGGPALEDATFQIAKGSSAHLPPIHHDTGDPVK